MVKQLRLQLFIDETRKNEWKVFGRKTTSGIEEILLTFRKELNEK